MRVAVLATGGKDSTLALYHVLKTRYDVKYLVTMIPTREDSWMFHYPNIGLVDLFAEAVGIPVAKAETLGVKEEELADLEHLVKTLDVEGIVSGAIASSYQKTRIEMICKRSGLECIAPLWRRSPLDILEEILDLGFETVMTGVYAYGFGKEWLGRKIDTSAVADLMELSRRHGVSLVGEGGEYETLVLDAPFFRKRIKIVEAEAIWKDQSGHLQIAKAELEAK
jgi:predicted ATP pyrophosphatase (TIGR00289 family)